MSSITFMCDRVDVDTRQGSPYVDVTLEGVDEDDIIDQLQLNSVAFLARITMSEAIDYFGEDAILKHLGIDKERYEELLNRYELK